MLITDVLLDSKVWICITILALTMFSYHYHRLQSSAEAAKHWKQDTAIRRKILQDFLDRIKLLLAEERQVTTAAIAKHCVCKVSKSNDDVQTGSAITTPATGRDLGRVVVSEGSHWRDNFATGGKAKLSKISATMPDLRG